MHKCRICRTLVKRKDSFCRWHFIDRVKRRVGKKSQRTLFWEKVKKTKSCWLWTGSIDPSSGYGRLRGKNLGTIHTQRFSWTLKYGPLERKTVIMLTCRNKLCVRPLHLSRASRRFYVLEKELPYAGEEIPNDPGGLYERAQLLFSR